MTNQTITAAHQFLRHETSAAHARVDALVGGGLHCQAAYVAYLRGMERFVALTQQVFPESNPELRACRAWLASDLSVLGVAALPPLQGRRATLDAIAQLGWEYVVAGAAVGARFLLRQAQALGHSAEHGARFLAGHATGDHWPRFLARLQRADVDTRDFPRLRQAALAAFAAAAGALQLAREPHADEAQADAARAVSMRAGFDQGQQQSPTQSTPSADRRETCA